MLFFSFLDRFLFDFDDSRSRSDVSRGFAITADDHMGLSAGGSGGGADGGGGAVFAASAALIASTSASVSFSFSSASKSSSESSKIALNSPIGFSTNFGGGGGGGTSTIVASRVGGGGGTSLDVVGGGGEGTSTRVVSGGGGTSRYLGAFSRAFALVASSVMASERNLYAFVSGRARLAYGSAIPKRLHNNGSGAHSIVFLDAMMGMCDASDGWFLSGSSGGAIFFGDVFSNVCKPTFSTCAASTTPPDVNVLLNRFWMRARSSLAMPSMLNFCLGAMAASPVAALDVGSGFSPNMRARSSMPKGRDRRSGGAAESAACSTFACATRHA